MSVAKPTVISNQLVLHHAILLSLEGFFYLSFVFISKSAASLRPLIVQKCNYYK